MDKKTELNSKLPDIGTSIFAVMSKLANDHNAINLSQGFPDFNCSDELIELVNHFMKNGFNQYAPMPGTIELRKEISRVIKTLYRKYYNPETEITITAGATQALFTAFSTLIEIGDEVIVFEPAYDSYIPAIKLNGGVPVTIKLNEKDYSIPWEKVSANISEKTKCIVVNSPHNPTGTVLSHDDISTLTELVKNKNIYLISDEVYEHIIFDGKEHLSIARYDELSKRSFVISSFGKTFHTTGWKTGYCFAPENLMKEFRKIHQFIVFAVNTPVQLAIAEYLKDDSNILELKKFYEDKRNLFSNLIKGSNFKLRECSGTYFQLLDYSDISEMNDMDFSKYLIEKIGVAVIPVSPFCSTEVKSKIVRVCFAKKDEVLINASKKLLSL
ncbi:MAG: methionine aminotransferase [Ignavibacteriaceae bacterium]|jgi:methionine aminotransferase|nr:methionine aminotransferase [Ignavibacteriaceae bacterium]